MRAPTKIEYYRNYTQPLNSKDLKNVDLSKEPNIFLRLKKYIIVLRRWGIQSIFNEYKRFFEKNFQEFLTHLETRELLSQVDSYVEWGTDHEAALGMIMITYIHQERRFLTMKKVLNFTTKMPLTQEEKGSMIFTKGNINSIRLSEDESVYLFYDKIFKQMSKHPLFYAIWLKIFTTQVINPESSISFICACSDDREIYTAKFKELLNGKYHPVIEEEKQVEDEYYFMVDLSDEPSDDFNPNGF